MIVTKHATPVLKETIILALAVFGAACQPGPNEPIASPAPTPSPTATVSGSPTATPVGAALGTREPEQYRATLLFTAEASNRPQTLALPIDISRNGSDRRYAVNLPAVGQLIFLDRNDKRYLIIPARHQFAELRPDLVGFDFRLLTPGQIALKLQSLRGVERVGEEEFNGRTITKFRHTGLTRTGTTVGDVTTQSFIYIDQETGLPLRAETFGLATGQVQGSNQGRVAMELKDLRTNVDPAIFDVPAGLRKLTDEEIKKQFNALAAIFQVILSSLNPQSATESTPAPVTPTPAVTVPPAS